MSSVSITYAGTDITADVRIADCSFTAYANGRPGQATVAIRAENVNATYVVGQELILTIDGVRQWGGYVIAVRRVYAFAADFNACGGLAPHYFILEGMDYSGLFSRRFFYNHDDPTLEMRHFSLPCTDQEVIDYYVSHYLDDTIDTSLVEYVAPPIIDQEVFLRRGASLGDGVALIGRHTGAVWYIDPDRKLVYTDVDTANAPFALSDVPTGTQIGYREATILFNGSELVNDAMAWGAGQGSDKVVFYRATNSASIQTHGLWQVGDWHADIYKPETIARVAGSWVYGSPQSKRGHKDDAVQIHCTVFEPGLRVAQKVRFSSAVFNFEDVIPIRELRISFINPTSPKYELGISHEIDHPWTTAEFPAADTTTTPPPPNAPTCRYISSNPLLAVGDEIPSSAQQAATGAPLTIVQDSVDGISFYNSILGGPYDVPGSLYEVEASAAYDYGSCGVSTNWWRKTCRTRIYGLSNFAQYITYGLVTIQANTATSGYTSGGENEVPRSYLFPCLWVGVHAPTISYNIDLWAIPLSVGEFDPLDAKSVGYKLGSGTTDSTGRLTIPIAFSASEGFRLYADGSLPPVLGVSKETIAFGGTSFFVGMSGKYYYPASDSNPGTLGMVLDCSPDAINFGQSMTSALYGSGRTWSVPYAYVPGSLQVWVNGLFQRPNADYFESGPTVGQFTFTYDVATNADVQVYYVPASALTPGSTVGSLGLPVSGPITQAFGPTSLSIEPALVWHGVYYEHFHQGVDFGVASGTPVFASAAGTVEQASYEPPGWEGGGNIVVISHQPGVKTVYAHNSVLNVFAGQVVSAGQQIALSGATGNVTGAHLHWALYISGCPENPFYYTG